MRGWAKAKARAAKLLGRLEGRRRRWVALGCVIILLGTVAAVFISRQVAMIGMRREIERLEAQKVAAAAEQKALRAELASTTDSKTLEEEIRRRLGLVKPGEEKVFFVEENGP